MGAKPHAMPGRRGRLILRRVFDAARTSSPARVSDSRAAAHDVRATWWFVDESLRDAELLRGVGLVRGTESLRGAELAAAPSCGASVPRDGRADEPQKPRQLPHGLLVPRYRRATICDKIPRSVDDVPLAEAVAQCPSSITIVPWIMTWPTIGPI